MAKLGITSQRGSFTTAEDAFVSRRNLRKQEKKISRARSARHVDAALVAERRRRWGTFTVMSVAFALVGTLGLPAYADNPATREFAPVVDLSLISSETQSLVSNDAAATRKRDQLAVASDAEAARANLHSSWSGPTAADFLKNPPNPKFSLAAVYKESLKYRGVPYVYGGSTPAGFDCSGFTMYVYASFGIALPHSANAQLRMGTQIAEADAQPGDLVYMEGHVGIWTGPGMMIDAPTEGRSVVVRPIYTKSYTVFRIGI